MTGKIIVIRKYENRRLYDSTNSRYVNLDEVAQMVRNGDDVQVVDAASGEDLTRLILTQIIVEDAKERDSAFPLDVLRQMVVASGRATQETALKYMKTMMDMYQNAYRVMAPPLNPFEFMRSPVAPPPSEAEVPSRGGTPESESRERKGKNAAAGVNELKKRVEELESLVSRIGGGNKKKTRRSATKGKRSKG